MSDIVFGAGSLAAGALLPASARSLIVRSAGLPEGALEADADRWLQDDIPVLVRGEARIIPLAWWGEPGRGYNPYAEPKQIDAFASRVQGAGLHQAGPWTLMDLTAAQPDSIGSYVQSLRAAGASKADAWVYPGDVGVVLVWAGTEEDGNRSLALHLTPVSWVFARGAGGPVPGIDVQWSWHDVIELYAARADLTSRNISGD